MRNKDKEGLRQELTDALQEIDYKIGQLEWERKGVKKELQDLNKEMVEE
jgi:hypothetical protein